MQDSKTPLGVLPAKMQASESDFDVWDDLPASELSPAELLRAFKRANPQVWTIKDEQVRLPPSVLRRNKR